MRNNFTAENFKSGQLLLIDKPLEWTSFQVVSKVRGLIKKSCGLKKIKVGHAGTLDPLASGLLLICTGKFTKQISTYQGQDKVYTGTMRLGATTPSYDMETEIDKEFPTSHLTADKLNAATTNFIGSTAQLPPVFSAVKKDGKRLYEYARKGEEVEIKPRTVKISQFDLTRIELPEVDFKVVCGKGTYIRSLAHDFGQEVQSGAYLSALRRTQIGDYHVEDALSLEEFIKLLPNAEQLF